MLKYMLLIYVCGVSEFGTQACFISKADGLDGRAACAAEMIRRTETLPVDEVLMIKAECIQTSPKVKI